MSLTSLVRLPVVAGFGLVSGGLATGGAALRVARDALVPGAGGSRVGSRLHLRLHGRPGVRRTLAEAARSVSLELAGRPEVLFAYWDGGLRRLVVQLTEDAVAEAVTARAAELAAEHGLAHASDQDTAELEAPGEVRDVRTAAAALAVDSVGATAALVGRMLPFRSSGLAAAVATLSREDPRIRDALRGRLGRRTADLLLTTANAAAHGIGASPTPLLLDAALRASQLAEAVARSAAHDAVADAARDPDRAVPAGDRPVERPVLEHPSDGYASNATTGSVLASLPALLRGGTKAAAAAVQAGALNAAGHGPAAFTAAAGIALARAGVTVCDPRRLRLLERVDTVVLHPSALRDPERPDADGLDPLADAVLDAARRAGLRVVVPEDPALGEFAALVDEVAPAEEPMAELVGRLRAQDRVVLTAARVPGRRSPEGPGAGRAVLAGLLSGDLAVSVTEPDAAVVWSADARAADLAGLWRLLLAVPAARRAGRQARTLATAGTALAGLGLVAGRRTPVNPVDVAAAGALAVGWSAAWSVAFAGRPVARRREPWHAMDPEEVRSRLPSPATSPHNALDRLAGRAGRLARAGARLPVLAPVRWSVRLAGTTAAELADPLTPVLAVGAAASAMLGSPVDALLVAGAMGLNAVSGGAQRLRAERAMAALAHGQRQRARRVAGSGRTALIGAERLEVGDLIALEVGDVVPADGRLLIATDLEVDESALTGESLPTPKRVEATPDTPLPERRCMVYEGTTVVTGQATAAVVATGAHTEAGRAVALASRTPPAPGLQAKLGELTGRALPYTLAGGAAVAGLSLLRGRPVREAVQGGVAVAVAAVPEGLPLVATVAQLAASRRLGRRGVLVRAPRALEALGRVDTVCFDKTGTLTENRLSVARVTTPDGTTRNLDSAQARELLRAAARACPRADADDQAHATDEAVLEAAPDDPQWRELDGLPFEAGRGYAATVGAEADGGRQLIVKGAPEVVLDNCGDSARHHATAAELAGRGLRVLAVARRELPDGPAPCPAQDPLGELELLGLLGIADRPRATAEDLVEGLRAVGVRPVMLTGDHPATALAIAEGLGWPADTPVATGDELAALDGAGRAEALRDVGVVARVAPEQKLQVVEALRDSGRVVAMVGDGANDAAAIRAADVGVGIAARGSAAARNAADLVLTNGDLTPLVAAVDEGRALWHSAADAVGILVGGNAGEIGFSVLGTLASGRSPLSTRQLLLVNLLTDMFPAMAVAVTPSEVGRPDEPVGTEILGAPLTGQIRRRGVITGIGAGAAWLAGTLTPGTARRTSTMTLCGLVGSQLTQTLAGRAHSPLVVATTLGSAAALAAVVQTPGVSHFFGCTPLGPVALAGVGAGIGAAALANAVQPS